MTTDTKLLVVDDDVVICNLLDRYLTASGYQVKSANDGEGMYRILGFFKPDLIILDLKLPDSNGLDLAKELRKKSDIGIIILTGIQDEVDKVVGLELGADDYLSKPFNERELLARIRSVLRRIKNLPHEQHSRDKNKASFADWTLDMVAQELISPTGENINLTSYEYQLLHIFVSNPNRVLSRDHIMENIAGRGWNPSDRSIDVLIGKLRKKIEVHQERPGMIKTIRGAGYKFTVSVDYS